MSADQPQPIITDGPIVKDAVIADIEALCERRRVKYGTHLQPNNGRNALVDLYEELVDAVLYLKQLMIEQEGAP